MKGQLDFTLTFVEGVPERCRDGLPVLGLSFTLTHLQCNLRKPVLEDVSIVGSPAEVVTLKIGAVQSRTCNSSSLDPTTSSILD